MSFRFYPKREPVVPELKKIIQVEFTKEAVQEKKPYVSHPVNVSPVDLDRLASAIAIHETGNCTLGVGPTHNNCFGIRYNGDWARYSTPEESYKDFKRIWSTHYKTFPTLAMAKKWTGSDRAEAWLSTVKKHY